MGLSPRIAELEAPVLQLSVEMANLAMPWERGESAHSVQWQRYEGHYEQALWRLIAAAQAEFLNRNAE